MGLSSLPWKALPVALIMAVLHLDGVNGGAIDTFNTSSKRGLIDIAEVKVEDTELLLRDSDISW